VPRSRRGPLHTEGKKEQKGSPPTGQLRVGRCGQSPGHAAPVGPIGTLPQAHGKPMHQPQLSRQPSLQGLPAPQAPVEVVWQAKERERRRSSNRRRGHSGRGSRRLKAEVIRPDAHRLKDNDNDVLSKCLEQLCRSFLCLSFSFTIVYLANAPTKAPRPEHFSARSARGLH